MKQIKKTYIPRISYKGKILLFFFLVVLTLTSCNAQVSTTTKNEITKQIAVDSVAYEIVEDSLSCIRPYRFHYVKTKYPDSIIQNKLNSNLLTVYWEEVSSLNKSYNQTLQNLKDYLDSMYCEGHLTLNDLFVVYNNNGYLTIEYQEDYKYINLYNFNLNTGELLQDNDVFSDTDAIIKLLELKVKEDLAYWIGIEKKEDTKNLLQETYNGYKYEKGKNYWGLGIKNDGIPSSNNGIYFLVYVESYGNHMRGTKAFFLTFDELKPYLTNQFKKQIGIN